jgi:hypothetical protein
MLSTPFEFQIVLTPKPMHHTESTTLVLSLHKLPRTAVSSNLARGANLLLIFQTLTTTSVS